MRTEPFRTPTSTSIDSQGRGVPLPYMGTSTPFLSPLFLSDSRHLQRRSTLSILKQRFLSQVSVSSCLARTDTNPDVHEGNKIILQDLLSLHMVRKTTTSTIISYHPSLQGTSAKRLQSLAQRTGDSVYWSKNFKRSKDPTILLLAMLWYALYAWDEAFEVLCSYINAIVRLCHF